jgi:hypothetical protein
VSVAGDRVDETVRFGLDDVGEPLAYGVETERAGERIPVCAVCIPVEREHARSDDLRG